MDWFLIFSILQILPLRFRTAENTSNFRRNTDKYGRLATLEVKRMNTPRDIPTWPVLHLTSIALAQLAAINFSDFLALIHNALPTDAVDQGRKRAAIVALAFGHLGLCKALLDKEELLQCQRIARLFQPHGQFCSFFCKMYPAETSPLRGKLGHVMEVVVRGNSNHIAWALEQQALPVNS